MAITHDDVRTVAALACLSVPAERLDSLVGELNGILGHMDALSRVSDAGAAADAEREASGMRLAPDQGPALSLERATGLSAPSLRDGFFLVPRLATHDSAGTTSGDEG